MPRERPCCLWSRIDFSNMDKAAYAGIENKCGMEIAFWLCKETGDFEMRFFFGERVEPVGNVSDGMEVLEIPAAKYAIFTLDSQGETLSQDAYIQAIKRYYCFACGESGDVIDFTAKLFGISAHSAAIRLARDFGIDPRPPTHSHIPLPDAEPLYDEKPCIFSLSQDLQRYRRWKREFAPEDPNEPYDNRFVEACRNLSDTEYLLDCALEAGCAA